jgi:hypothetical protein
MTADDPSVPRTIDISASSPIEARSGSGTNVSTPTERSGFDCEHAFKETGNRMFVWDQMYLASRAKQPIPDWCQPVLDKFLSELFAAKSVFRDEKLSYQKIVLKLSAMIGLDLGQQGKANAIKRQDRWYQRAKVALDPSGPASEWAERARRKPKKSWRW